MLRAIIAMRAYKYSEILEGLRDFDDWLLSLGLIPRRNDRVHKAIHALREADVEVRSFHETGQCAKIPPEHLYPLVEALEAWNVYRSFRDYADGPKLKHILERALSGPAQAADEKIGASSDGRNVWFELALAAEWRSRGAIVSIGEPDLRVHRDNCTFLIACKRPATDNSVRANIRGAISQLNDHLRAAPNGEFGVVAISLSRALTAGRKYWQGTLEELGTLVYQLMGHYKDHWRSAAADPRICGILFHVATPTDVGQRVDLSLASYTVAGSLKETSTGSLIFQQHINAMKAREAAENTT